MIGSLFKDRYIFSKEYTVHGKLVFAAFCKSNLRPVCVTIMFELIIMYINLII